MFEFIRRNIDELEHHLQTFCRVFELDFFA